MCEMRTVESVNSIHFIESICMQMVSYVLFLFPVRNYWYQLRNEIRFESSLVHQDKKIEPRMKHFQQRFMEHEISLSK